MQRVEYKVLEVQVNRAFVGPKIPDDLGVKVDELAAQGWELDKCVPIMSKGWLIFGGSYTESVLLFFRRAIESRDG